MCALLLNNTALLAKAGKGGQIEELTQILKTDRQPK